MKLRGMSIGNVTRLMAGGLESAVKRRGVFPQRPAVGRTLMQPRTGASVGSLPLRPVGDTLGKILRRGRKVFFGHLRRSSVLSDAKLS